ncbi:phosphotransferase family protein [Natrarchaeobaculum aegyptiacum]|uniref:Aminoglycoside phosphotransferase domain-containing protein n=1 Tax=Natrarchaeobaculum aegyptiacum TaxID=745377 RepID=A0A2Z2HQC4_9EURY|nr:phosphotransferase [Natrarchaeobaculum aegyptiacum]ARS89291.1 hypothetical protein B1756_05725 [Natrarchaeobaculum aegyptiacum]
MRTSDAVDHLPEHVRRLVAEVLETSINSWCRPTTGSVSETYLLELAGEPSHVVCKLDGASVWTGAVVEPAIRRLVAEGTTLPVPAVLASGRFAPRNTDGELGSPAETTSQRSWALYEFAAGETPSAERELLSQSTRRRLVADAGSTLGQLHAWSRAELEFDRTGGLERAPDHPTGLRVCDPTPPSAVDALVPVVRTLSGRSGGQPVLCHGDYQPDNLLVDPDGSVTAVLDWGNAHVAPAEYAVARAEVRFVESDRSRSADERSQLRETFREAYREETRLEPGYADRAPLYRGLWLVQSGLNLATVARTARGRTQLRRQLSTWWGS